MESYTKYLDNEVEKIPSVKRFFFQNVHQISLLNTEPLF